MKRILLINPPLFEPMPISNRRQIPYGLLKIGSYLKELGHDVRLIDCWSYGRQPDPVVIRNCGNHDLEGEQKAVYHWGKSFPELREELVRNGEPDEIFVTSSMTYYWESVHETIRVCKEVYPDTKVILGGIYASLCPEHAGRSLADEVHVGLFEPAEKHRTAMELLEGKCDFAIIKYSRGCPNNCSYCAVPLLEGHEMEFADHESFVAELEEKVERFGIRTFHLWESNLLVDAPNRFEKVLDLIIERGLDINLRFPEGLQANLIYPRLAEKMKKAGVVHLALPLESSDDDLCKNRFHRSVTLAQWRESVRMLKEAGFIASQINAYILAGIPGQSVDSIVRTYFEVLASYVKIGCLSFTPIPGTREFDRYEKLIEGKDLEDLHPKLWPCANPELTVADLEDAKTYKSKKSFYDMTLSRDSRIKRMLLSMLGESIVKVDLADTGRFTPEPGFHLLDLADGPGAATESTVTSLLSGIKKAGGTAALLRPLPKELFDTDLEEIPHHCADCIALALGLCDTIGDVHTEKELGRKMIALEGDLDAACRECAHYIRNRCRIMCESRNACTRLS